MDNDEFKKRLNDFRASIGLTVNSFEKRAGLSNGYIKNFKGNMGRDKLEKLLSAFPELNKEWLLTGEGDMLNDTKASTKDTDFTLVPLVNIDSVGGMDHSNLLSSSEQYIERLIPFTEARQGDIAIYQSGDSMNPGIPSGSILLIRNVPDWREYFGYGDVFVLWLRDDRRLTKQVRKYTPDPSNFVTCHSFNPDYGDEELPKKYIREVWKVIKVLADKGW